MASANVGDTAPDIDLEGTQGHFKLSEQRGRKVLVLFYPGDDTPVCTRQFCSYRDDSAEMEALDAIVVGISAQSEDSHAAFAAKYGLNVPLLADKGGKVAKAYGAWRPVVGTQRAVFGIDEEGVVRQVHKHMLGLDFQSVGDLREMLASF